MGLAVDTASRGEASGPRMVVVEDGVAHEVFEVVGIEDGLARVRSAYLFELGEELVVRVEDPEGVLMRARVRAHVGPSHARVTELELSDYKGE